MNVAEQIQHVPEQIKIAGDALSVGAVIGAITGILPAIAALFTIIWTAIRIYETETVQRLLGNRRRRRTDREPPA